MFEYINKSIEINYDNGNNYRVDYLSDKKLKWTNLDNRKDTETDPYFINEQALGIFTIIWVEKSGLQVCQNLDFNTNQVYALLTWDNKKEFGNREIFIQEGTFDILGDEK
jgi:hypothetical protein